MDTAAALRQLEDAFKEAKQSAAHDAQAKAVVARDHEVSEAIDHHLDQAHLQTMVAAMRHAAENGEYRYLALRFASDICTDAGRSINSGQPDWPATLRGEAADLYHFWEEKLKPAGFQLSAEVLNFPAGKPGDVGLTFTWG
jgi:nitrogen fixation protein FixH